MSQPLFTPAHFLAVAVGSAFGGAARFALTAAVGARAGVAFPVGTLTVNILGCFALGVLMQWTVGRADLTQLLLTTGFCGGFTTFSTFSYEAIRLAQEGLWSRASAYVALSVGAGLAALWVGMMATRAASAAR